MIKKRQPSKALEIEKDAEALFLRGRIALMDGKMTRSSKLRIGYFAQHQVDELHLDETPLQHLQRERPEVMPSRLRAQIRRESSDSSTSNVTVEGKR